MWFASQSIPQRATYKLPLNLALNDSFPKSSTAALGRHR
uniref:Uncharacterized protein n=1 Tax=Pseudomonas aeruginosa TaxID=287 RepID=A0A8D5Y960_PSEAI|nr:hypothetical protein [Pseudomonas aeruginosa]